ncbi:MAG TPA: ABC transporter ATP-binding protein [Stellaceae bacterium]|nr:ABC transporter ATP-binding protein [Stellaceae bacterium]
MLASLKTLPDTEPDTVLSVTGLNAFYGLAHILFDVSLELGHGQVLALLGRNGAGKSTTFKSIMGVAGRSTGTILFGDRRIDGLSPSQRNRLGLGYVPEDRRIFADLTTLENLEVGRQVARPGVPVWTPERLFALFPNLGELRHRAGGRMSGGEQQMLTIARTLMGNPSVILLDEPSEGLSPKIVEQMAQAILHLKAEGLSVVLSEQNLHFATLVADRATIIESGRIRYAGDMAELRADAELQREFLSA